MQQKPQDQQMRSVCRRSRKDQDGRDYICGCGKKYLSYPALYTHIKTKHDGKQPQGTQKTGSHSNIRRNKPKFDQQMLKDIHSYMERQDIKVLDQVKQCQGCIPISNRIPKDQLPKQIYQSYQSLYRMNTIKINRNSTLEMLLTIYLLNIGQYVSQRIYQYYIFFAKTLWTCYNEHGQQIYENCFNNKQNGAPYLSTFKLNQCKYVPIISDFIIRYYYVNLAEEKDIYINISLMELLLDDFCLWMKKRCLTCVSVSLNKPYKLTQPLKAIVSKSQSQKQNSLDSNDKKNEGSDSQESDENEVNGDDVDQARKLNSSSSPQQMDQEPSNKI